MNSKDDNTKIQKYKYTKNAESQSEGETLESSKRKMTHYWHGKPNTVNS